MGWQDAPLVTPSPVADMQPMVAHTSKAAAPSWQDAPLVSDIDPHAHLRPATRRQQAAAHLGQHPYSNAALAALVGFRVAA